MAVPVCGHAGRTAASTRVKETRSELIFICYPQAISADLAEQNHAAVDMAGIVSHELLKANRANRQASGRVYRWRAPRVLYYDPLSSLRAATIPR